MPKVVSHLHSEPRFRTRTESFRESNSHIDRYTCALIHQIRKRLARDAQCFRGFSDGEAQGIEALTSYDTAGMGWIVHSHKVRLPSDSHDSPHRQRGLPRNGRSPANSQTLKRHNALSRLPSMRATEARVSPYPAPFCFGRGPRGCRGACQRDPEPHARRFAHRIKLLSRDA
jgi:hypothetical protein